MARPRANVRQDSRGTEQSAQAGGAGICEGLVWAERPGWASGAAASHWWDSHVTEQMMVPGPAWLWRVGVRGRRLHLVFTASGWWCTTLRAIGIYSWL